MLMNQRAKIIKLIGGIHSAYYNSYYHWIEPEVVTKPIYVREAILQKGTEKINRRLEFISLQEATDVSVGDIVSLKETNFSDKDKSLMRLDLDRYSEINDVYTNLKDIADTTIDLKVGDKCKVVNPYGVVDGPYRIRGFVIPNKFGCSIILDWPTPWVFASVNGLSILKSNRYIPVKAEEILFYKTKRAVIGEHIIYNCD